MYEADSEGPAYVRVLGTLKWRGPLDDDDGFGSLPPKHTHCAVTTEMSFIADLWNSFDLSRAFSQPRRELSSLVKLTRQPSRPLKAKLADASNPQLSVFQAFGVCSLQQPDRE